MARNRQKKTEPGVYWALKDAFGEFVMGKPYNTNPQLYSTKAKALSRIPDARYVAVKVRLTEEPE